MTIGMEKWSFDMISGKNVEQTNLQFDADDSRSDCTQIWTLLTSEVENSEIVGDQNQRNGRNETEACSLQ